MRPGGLRRARAKPSPRNGQTAYASDKYQSHIANRLGTRRLAHGLSGRQAFGLSPPKSTPSSFSSRRPPFRDEACNPQLQQKRGSVSIPVDKESRQLLEAACSNWRALKNNGQKTVLEAKLSTKIGPGLIVPHSLSQSSGPRVWLYLRGSWDYRGGGKKNRV
jgi:hypothetical protein